MNKTKAFDKLNELLNKCNELLEHAQENDNRYISYPDFQCIKVATISIFKTMNVDNAFIDAINKMNGQACYEIETIRDFICEVLDLFKNEMIGPTPGSVYKEYDVFLSHASKDKKTYVRQLYQELKELRIKIFYDEKTLTWGDDWEEKINEGLKRSEFAIVVLSKNFFGREWPEKELDSLLERKNSIGQKLILPILHGVSIKAVKKRYPKVASIQSIDSSNKTPKDVAILFAAQFIHRLRKEG